MRFMLGLLIGAAMVLTLAQVLELRPAETVDWLRSHWSASKATGAFEGAAAASFAGGTDEADPPPVERSTTADQDPGRSHSNEPYPIERDPVERDPVERDPVERDPVDQAGLPAQIGDADQTDTHVAVASTGPEVTQTVADADADADARVETVWTPFYSQLSADGFARRMTGFTAHPFSVRREGAGRYQVVFAYTDEDERARVLSALATATGSEAP